MTARILAVLMTAHGFATVLQAQEPPDTIRPDTVFTVEEIAVKVSRAVTTAGGASALSTPLDSVVVPPAPTLDEVLRRMPLVLVRENSRGEAQPR